MERQSLIACVICISPALVAAGCARTEEKPAGQAPATDATPRTAVNVSELESHMEEHFARIKEIQEAVIRGDLEAAKAPATWIADHEERSDLPSQAAPQVAAMKAAAKSVATTTDLKAAGTAAATLVGSCGTCHSATKATPDLPAPSIAEAGAGRPAHMADHQYAVDLLYRGLAAPSDEDWRKGAEALKGASLGGKDLPEVSTEAVAAEQTVHQLADRAAGAADQSARVAVYGEIIGSCASCHGTHGRVWGPGLRGAE